jgi:hypothetical protein
MRRETEENKKDNDVFLEHVESFGLFLVVVFGKHC